MVICLTLDDILHIISEENIQGSTNQHITTIATLSKATLGSLSFLTNSAYKKQVHCSQASVILLPKDFDGTPSKNQVFLRVENPSFSLALICEHIEQKLNPLPKPEIHPSAVIHPSAIIHEKATIGPLCTIGAETEIDAGTVLEGQVFVGKKVLIGKSCFIRANVVIANQSIIGNHVSLSTGVVIGSDGFGYSTTAEGKHYKEPQIGRILIEDHVEIGANSTIDRARIDETRIGEGTKIDNLVQIAHNVVIGRNCLIAAQVGIAGSTVIEDNVCIGGQAGINGHIKISQGTMISGKAGVTKDVLQKTMLRGNPATPIHIQNRILAAQRKLPELLKKVAKIETLLHSIINK